MRYFLISDNPLTLSGVRLAGIEGVCVTERQEVSAALKKCVADPEIAIVLITEKLKALCVEEVYSIMLERSLPLIVEIPGPEGFSPERSGILGYIRDAIGLKV